MEVQLGGFSAGNPIKGICMQIGRLFTERRLKIGVEDEPYG